MARISSFFGLQQEKNLRAAKTAEGRFSLGDVNHLVFCFVSSNKKDDIEKSKKKNRHIKYLLRFNFKVYIQN
jgi:hypothetical protein